MGGREGGGVEAAVGLRCEERGVARGRRAWGAPGASQCSQPMGGSGSGRGGQVPPAGGSRARGSGVGTRVRSWRAGFEAALGCSPGGGAQLASLSWSELPASCRLLGCWGAAQNE